MRRRYAIGSLLRILAFNAVLLLLYCLAPLDERIQRGVLIRLALAILVLLAVTIWELRSILRSSFPELRAVEAVGMMLPLALLPFATAYFTLSREVSGSFNADLTRLDALYFTVTTFATVGYGDLVPRSEVARGVALAQMVIDLVLIGFIAKAIVGVARRRRASLRGDAER
jgi:hypothetical protein